MTRAPALVMSSGENWLSPTLTGLTRLAISLSSIGARPICLRQRLTVSASHPPSPGKVTIDMSTLPPFGAVALKLANRIDEGATTVQPSGAFHLIEGAV